MSAAVVLLHVLPSFRSWLMEHALAPNPQTAASLSTAAAISIDPVAVAARALGLPAGTVPTVRCIRE